MSEIWTGWVRWFDSRPVEHRIARLIDRPPRVTRADLGHLDKSVWEADLHDNARDPWAQTERMVMRETGDNGDLVTFTTSSTGGRVALAKLCGIFNRESKKHESQWPVVQLDTETYTHNRYGEIAKPVFHITGWAFWDGADKPTQTAEDPRTLTQTDEALDDAIPF